MDKANEAFGLRPNREIDLVSYPSEKLRDILADYFPKEMIFLVTEFTQENHLVLWKTMLDNGSLYLELYIRPELLAESFKTASTVLIKEVDRWWRYGLFSGDLGGIAHRMKLNRCQQQLFIVLGLNCFDRCRQNKQVFPTRPELEATDYMLINISPDHQIFDFQRRSLLQQEKLTDLVIDFCGHSPVLAINNGGKMVTKRNLSNICDTCGASTNYFKPFIIDPKHMRNSSRWR